MSRTWECTFKAWWITIKNYHYLLQIKIFVNAENVNFKAFWIASASFSISIMLLKFRDPFFFRVLHDGPSILNSVKNFGKEGLALSWLLKIKFPSVMNLTNAHPTVPLLCLCFPVWSGDKKSKFFLPCMIVHKLLLHFFQEYRLDMHCLYMTILPQNCCYNVYDSLHKKMKFSITDFFSICDQIRSFLLIWSHLLKKSLMENFTFCAVILGKTSGATFASVALTLGSVL